MKDYRVTFTFETTEQAWAVKRRLVSHFGEVKITKSGRNVSVQCDVIDAIEEAIVQVLGREILGDHFKINLRTVDA